MKGFCLVFAFSLSVGASAYAQGCQDQVCDLHLGSTISGQASCYPTCIVATEDCPKSCISIRCGSKRVGNQTKNGLPECRVVLAQYRKDPIPKTHGDSLQMTLWYGAEGDPLQLVGVTHNADKDLFQAGIVWNASAQDVVSYRIGWLIYSRSESKPLEREGHLRTLKKALTPDQTVAIPAQGVDPNESADGLHNRIVFYIAETILADGTDWHPDLTAIEKKYNPVQP